MTARDIAASGSPVLRSPAAGEAPRLIGRARTSASPSAPDAVAAALSRLAPGASRDEPRALVDEAALQRAREEGRQAGLLEGREQALREQAHAGFEEGLRQGLVEGRGAGEIEAQRRLASAQEQAAERLQRLEQFHAAWAEQLHAAFHARLDGAEEDMVALCHGVICRLLGDHLVTQAGAAQAVRTAIETWLQSSEKQLRGEGVTVHVHPGDLDAMKHDDMLARWLVQQGLRGMAWEASDSVRMGGCIVRSDEGDLDARLETQLASLRAQLSRSRHGAGTATVEPAVAITPPEALPR